MTKNFENKIKRMFGCDTVRISAPMNRKFLIIGNYISTIEQRKKNPEYGEFYFNGKKRDFIYLEEQVITSGRNEHDLYKAAKYFKSLEGKKWTDMNDKFADLLKLI